MLFRALKGDELPKRVAFIAQTPLAVRLTTVLLLATCLHLSAETLAKINLSEQHSSLDKIFRKITDQTGMLFVYRDEWLKQTRDVSISVHDASLKEVLDICFKDQPFTYVIIDKMVVLKEKPVVADTVPMRDEPRQQGLTIRGRVADSLGTPLAGASIRIKGTTKGNQSGIRGEFELKNIPEGTVLVISYTGYISKELIASAKGNPYHLVVLSRSQDELDATVIQAYGTTSRRFNIGSISTVDAETIEKQPVTNILLALEGQAPGLAINETNGVPGSNALVQVRGQNTVTSNPLAVTSAAIKPYDQPLFIVDGVPFAPQNTVLSQLSNLAEPGSFGGGISQFTGISAFAGINPADIESVSILKDADATSVYGTQGSNGVILITTKRGRAGKTSFNLTANTGYNSAAREVRLMNTQQYLQLRNEAFALDSVTPGSNPNDATYAPDLTIYDQNRYTDWQKVIYGKTSNNTDIHASLSGGTINNTFMLTGGYTRSDFNYPGNFANQRLTLHNAYHHLSPDDRLTIDEVMDYSYNQNNSAAFGGGQDILLPPNAPALLDSTGNLVWNYKGVNMSSSQFYATLKQPTGLETYNLNNSLRLGYKLMTGLSIAVNLGYNRNTSNEHSENPAVAQSPLYINRGANFAANNFETINIEPQLDFNRTMGNGQLSVLLGGTYKKNTNYQNEISGYGYGSDALLGSIDGAASTYSYDNSSLYKYAAVFGRLKYIYDQQYILSLTGRRDGSSNFGPGRQFGDFGSVGGGWIFSEEKGFRKKVPVISFGKLSASYGTSGSDGVAPYQYQPFWGSISSVNPFQGSAPMAPQNLYNPVYSWALKKSLNVSMDLGFFHDRLLANATYYRDREGNQLGLYTLPSQAGFEGVLENLPADLQNQGWEFTMTSHNIQGKKFNWTTSFNITFNRNKLLAFPNLEESPYSLYYQIGKPASLVFGYKYAGVDPTTGVFEYYDQKGNKTINPTLGLPADGGDLAPIANQEVKYMGGFGNTINYARFSLYVFFQFSSQTAPNYLNQIYNGGPPGLTALNLPAAMVGQFWTKPGDAAQFQRPFVNSSTPYPPYNQTNADLAASNFYLCSAAYSDDTYVRLKTVALSYSLPDAWLRRVHIKDCKVYVNAQNLLTFTDFKVADPETFGNITTFPIQRTVACGLNFNF
jgi:TonB-linked SusC/RagA family outer membrane protein